MDQFKMPVVGVLPDVQVYRFEITQVPKKQVAIEPVLLSLAKRDEIPRIKLKLWVDVKRLDVVDLKLLIAPADRAKRIRCQVCFSHLGPARRPFRTFRNLALNPVTDVA
jgi:hypothetical protein